MPAQLIEHFFDEPRRCTYLQDCEAVIEHRIMLDVDPEEFEQMLERGWRRFGPDYFRPSCRSGCACVPLRVRSSAFKPSRSQERAARHLATRFRMVIGLPAVDEQRLSLFRRWHDSREKARGWESMEMTVQSFWFTFAFPHPCVREIAYYDDHASGGKKLVGVGICDETPDAISAAFFYYDPDYLRFSPGTAHIVHQIDRARSEGRACVYLGYTVAGCPWMEYKSKFRHHELLVGWPTADEAPDWQG